MKTAAALAREIWSEYYAPIIGLDQVEYMLDKFQSVEAIPEQIATSDYWYFLIRDENRAVGYLGLQRRQETLFLSKLYLKNPPAGGGWAGGRWILSWNLPATTGCRRFISR